MPGTSPGWPGLGPSSLVMLVTLATTAVTLSDLSDNDRSIVRLDIGSVDQPANCSGFLDDLEVRWFLKIVHFLLKMWYSIMDDIEFSIWKLEMLCFPTTCENSWKWSRSPRCSADDDANLITAGVKTWSTLQKYWLELSNGCLCLLLGKILKAACQLRSLWTRAPKFTVYLPCLNACLA